MKITAHKTFKNKFDKIRAGIIFIYCQNTSMIGYSVFRQTNKNISPPIRTCSFFVLQYQRMYFQSRKLTNIMILFYFLWNARTVLWYLFLLYWVLIPLYSVLMSLYAVLSLLYSVLIPLYSVLMSLYAVLSSLYSVLIPLYSVLPSLYQVRFSL